MYHRRRHRSRYDASHAIPLVVTGSWRRSDAESTPSASSRPEEELPQPVEEVAPLPLAVALPLHNAEEAVPVETEVPDEHAELVRRPSRDAAVKSLTVSSR